MKHAFDVISEVAATSGKLSKRAILKENENNLELKAVLKLAYDRSFNWYTTVIPKITGPVNVTNTLEYALRVLVEELSTRKVSGGAAKELVKTLFHTLNDEDRQCLAWVIKRDVKAGISEKSILEIWPKLVPYFPYMRCSSKGELSAKRLSEVKGDGIFSRWLQKEKTTAPLGSLLNAHTRNGTPLINLPKDLYKEFTRMGEGAFEGEMLIEEDGKILPREKGNGIINACFIHGKRDLLPNQSLKVQLWELITIEEYWAGLSLTPRLERLSNLEERILEADTESIFLNPYWIVTTHQEAVDHYNEVVAAGGEGTIGKELDAIYKDGTSKDQVKMKVEEVVELYARKLVPSKEGSKNENTFGSILCESACGKLKVAVTGFSDKLRLEIFLNWDYYQDKVMGVKSNGPLPPSKSNPLWSLFLPRHEDWRDTDKNTADTLERIWEVFDVT